MLDYTFSTEINKVIKVVGVGGGGSKAVNHMYEEGIHNVTFAVCNADVQDLNSSPVPVKLQIGKELTDGLGCGSKPDMGRAAALESEESIKEMLNDGTKMVFVTAGMGGGTGTGAAPVIARIAKEMGILTVGIVTIPFEFELQDRIQNAYSGIIEMRKHVDALLIIINEKLMELYKNMSVVAAFCKADEVLSDAAKGIAEMITLKGDIINVDFADVNTILKDSGVAIMNTGMAEGENRVQDAIEEALSTPLLRNKDIKKATRILLYIYTSEEDALTMSEMSQISAFAKSINKNKGEKLIWGGTYDNALEKSIKITIIATGFELEDFLDLANVEEFVNLYYGGGESVEEQPAAPVPESDTVETTEEVTAIQEEKPEDEGLEVVKFPDWANDEDDYSDLDTAPRLRGKRE